MDPSSLAPILFGMAFLCLFLAAFPFGPYQITLLIAKKLGMGRPLPQGGDDDAQDMRFAICLCAYNEEAVIGEKIDNMLALRKAAGTLDILIYVDAASDRTAEIAASYEPEVTLVDFS